MKSALLLLLLVPFVQAQTPRHRNVIIFVADGLRHGSVNPTDTPTLYAIRTQGVHFENSYSLFPTVTTANASAIATGHRLGDTGDFSNGLYVGFQIFDTGNFHHDHPGTTMPFIENDEVLADLDSHEHGNYLNEATLLALARQNGFNTAAIGKLGPTAIQDVSQLNPMDGDYPQPSASATVIIDDNTNYDPQAPAKHAPASIPLPPAVVDRLLKSGVPVAAPSRNNGYPPRSPYDNSFSGDASHPGTLAANVGQQQWFADVTTHALLPMFAESGKPFVLLFWSRDPDASQHDEGDSLNKLRPGINGITSTLGVRNADHSLHEIVAWLDAHPSIKANTDIFVTSDHGFATASRHEIDHNGAVTKSEAAHHLYYDASGQLDTPAGFLPNGFLAIDLAVALHTRLWDPDSPNPPGSSAPYKEVQLSSDGLPHPNQWERPRFGNGFLGDAIQQANGSDSLAIIAGDGGSDLIYVPTRSTDAVHRLVKALLSFDYVGAIFVDDQYGKVSGTLPLSAVDLTGTALLPRPAIVVGFKVFYLTPGNLMQGIQLSDSSLQQGQGNHGGFGRECTWNNMAAIGPDFKRAYIDKAPVANSDITPTVAAILRLKLQPKGKLEGRIIEEALAGKPDAPAPKTKPVFSDPDHELRTVVFMQEFGGQKYFDSACMAKSKDVPSNFCHQQ